MLLSNQDLKAVCIFDPAIANSVPIPIVHEYVRSRKFDLIAAYIRVENPPTIYSYRRLSRGIMDRFIDTKNSDESKSVAAFQFGVTGALNLRTEDGAKINWAPGGKVGTSDGEIVTLTDKEMELFSRAEEVEIGTVIYNASFLPPWLERGYVVPRSSLSLWERQDVPLVDATPSTPPQNNEKP